MAELAQLEFEYAIKTLNNPEIIKALLPYLTYENMKGFRELSRNWRDSVVESSKFCARLKGKIADKWYKDVLVADGFEKTLKWNSCELNQFLYRGIKLSFKNYWHSAAALLNKLVISRCSMECDGFILLLGHCPVLQTLVLSRSNFRDLDDFHNDDRYHKGFPEAPPAPQIQSPILHLTIEYTYKLEHCFMEYLISRTGQLESLTLTSCFYSPEYKFPIPLPKYTKAITAKYPAGPTATDRFLELERNICNLIVRNSDTLTKIGLHTNNYQNRIFSTLSIRPQAPVRVPELGLTLVSGETDYQPVIQFIRNCIEVEQLSLSFDSEVSSAIIDQMLSRYKSTLRKLEISVVGDRILNGVNLPSFKDFEKLESLRVKDTKTLKYADVRLVVGKRRNLMRPNAYPTEALVSRIATNLNTEFLDTLPPTLTKLSACKIITAQNFLRTMDANSPAAESFRKLTSLEIRGPWIHPVGGMVQTIAKDLKQLESLILVNCGVDDAHIAGLGELAVQELRQCVTVGLVMHRPEVPDQGREIIDNAEQEMQLQFSGPGRSRLSDIQTLKHLDLSMNPGISDVSLFDGLKIAGLKALSLNSNTRITDAGMEHVVVNFPNLVTLGVRNCRKISKYGLNRVVEDCRRIRRIYTSRAIARREINGFNYNLNPNYDDIVKASRLSPSTAPVEFEMD